MYMTIFTLPYLTLVQAYVHQSVLNELKRIIEDSEILQEDDSLWPTPDRVGRQELEIVMGDEHISFSTSKIGSLVDVNQSKYENHLFFSLYFVISSFFCSFCFISGMPMDYEHFIIWSRI